MAAPRAQQVIHDQVLIRPDRYPGYHADLISLINNALSALGDGASAPKRRKDLADAVRAKASQMPSTKE